MAINEIDAVTRHQIYVGRYSTNVANRLIALLNRADKHLLAQIAVVLQNAPESFKAAYLDNLLRSVNNLLKSLYEEVGNELQASLRQFAKNEAHFNMALLNNAAGRANVVGSLASVSPNTVYAAAMARPFQGVLLKEALKGIESGVAKRIRDEIRMGIVEGRTNDQMVRAIYGTRANGYADGLLNWSRRGVDSLVRTAVNHTSNVARQVSYEANSDLLRGWMFVATLDGRTTLTCAALSGKIFPIGQGPMPPRHWGCRSTSIPMFKGQEKLLGQRASKDGPVDANLDFSDWLRNQPHEVQDDILGPTRAELFRAKKIQIDRFTDARGNVLTLEQLKKKDKTLFELVK